MSTSPISLPLRWSPGSTVILGQVITWSLLDWLLLVLPLPEEYVIPAIFGLASAQYATLAGWLALGDGSVIVRAGFAIHGVLWTELINPVGAPFGIAIVVAGIFLGIMTTPLILWRLAGWSCRLPDASDGGKLRPVQFGIWHVLVLMTLVAAALGVWRLIPEQHPAIRPVVSVLALVLGILTWTQWLVLLRSKLGAMLLVVVGGALVSWIVGFVVITLTIGAVDALFVWTWLVVIHTLVQGVNLLILRANGFRLLRWASTG